VGREKGRVRTERRECEERRVQWRHKGESGKREGESEDRKERVDLEEERAGRERGSVGREGEWEDKGGTDIFARVLICFQYYTD
jgi:hypothetical protein